MTKLDKQYIEHCSSLFNRSREQTTHLFNLVDNSIYHLIAYELLCKKYFIVRCPNTKEELRNQILWHIRIREEVIDGKEMV